MSNEAKVVIKESDCLSIITLLNKHQGEYERKTGYKSGLIEIAIELLEYNHKWNLIKNER